jgi:hypothetical protein
LCGPADRHSCARAYPPRRAGNEWTDVGVAKTARNADCGRGFA